MDHVSGSGYASFTEQIENIPVPEVQEALLEAFNAAAHAAYEPIYVFTSVMALIMIVIAVSFRKKFQADAIEDRRLDEERSH